jgi:hypothetical protein
MLHVGAMELRAFEAVTLAVALILALACVGSAWRTSRALAVVEPPRRWPS